jgi:hypothetical protein
VKLLPTHAFSIRTFQLPADFTSQKDMKRNINCVEGYSAAD